MRKNDKSVEYSWNELKKDEIPKLRDNASQSKKDLKMKWTGINGQYEK